MGGTELTIGATRRKGPSRWSLLVLPLALVGLMAFPSPAQAAFGLENIEASPANTDAGAKSDFHVHLDVTTPAEGLRDLTVSLPPGLSGNPQSVPKCPVDQLNADACPAASQIGTTSVQITASLVPLTVDGSVYNVVPEPGEPARLGIVLRPPDPTELLLPPIVQQVEVSLRPDFGLDTALTDLPQNAKVLGVVPVPIAINSIDLDLDGSFMRNPTSCGTQTTAFAARSWVMSASDPAATGSASYGSTNCDKQPYEPNASLDIFGEGELVEGSRPTVTSVITQKETEANNGRAAVLLPAAIGADAARLTTVCLPADFQTGACAANTQVGNATAVTPLLDSPLTGPVYVVDNNNSFPKLGIDLKGTLPLKILGSTGVADSRLETIFEGLPDLPLSSFELTFPGGPQGLLMVTGDVCAESSTFGVDFASQAGQELSRTLPTTETGCPTGDGGPDDGPRARKPRAKIRVTGARKRSPRVSIRVKSGGAPMRTVRVKLPKALKLGARAQRRVVVKADGKRIRARKKLLAKGRTLKAHKLPGKGANVLTINVRRGAIKRPRKIRPGKKLVFGLKVLRPGQKPANLKVRTRARR